MDYSTHKTHEHEARERAHKALCVPLLDGLSDPAIFKLGERLGNKGARPGSTRARIMDYLTHVLRVRELRRNGSYSWARVVEREAEALFAGLPRFFRE